MTTGSITTQANLPGLCTINASNEVISLERNTLILSMGGLEVWPHVSGVEPMSQSSYKKKGARRNVPPTPFLVYACA